MYDAARNEFRSPSASTSQSAATVADDNTASATETANKPHGNLAMLLSPTDENQETTSASFFDVDIPEDNEPEAVAHQENHQVASGDNHSELVEEAALPEKPAPTVTTRPYNPNRITPAKDMLRPLKGQDLWINPNLNILRLSKAQQAESESKASGSRSQNGHAGTKRPAEDEGVPDGAAARPRPHKHLRAEEAIMTHYNERRNVTLSERDRSPIIGLKNFNNWVKTVLINKFCINPLERAAAAAIHPAQHDALSHKRSRMVGGQALNTSLHQSTAGRRLKVLDLGCGKGGDLKKWAKVGTGDYLGCDIAAMSVEEARRRYNTSRSDQRPGSASFKVLDCFGNALDTVLTPEEQEKPFDTVSMQFCLHYAFENEFKARMMLDNVSKHLRYGGMFVGTIPDSEFILEKLREIPSDSGPPYVFGNSRYNISFDHKPDVEITEEGDTIMEPFGTKYTFYLQDAVDHVPEYLVPWRQFEELAKEYNLELVHFSTFSDLFYHEKEVPEFAHLMKNMRVVNNQGESDMDIDEWEAATIYVAFAFVKN